MKKQIHITISVNSDTARLFVKDSPQYCYPSGDDLPYSLDGGDGLFVNIKYDEDVDENTVKVTGFNPYEIDPDSESLVDDLLDHLWDEVDSEK